MSVAVQRQEVGDLHEENENCCFCNRPTPYWAVEKNVPCCLSCAAKHSEFHVPTPQQLYERQERAAVRMREELRKRASKTGSLPGRTADGRFIKKATSGPGAAPS